MVPAIRGQSPCFPLPGFRPRHGRRLDQLLSGSDNMLDLLEKQKIEILRVIFIDLKKDTKCDLL